MKQAKLLITLFVYCLTFLVISFLLKIFGLMSIDVIQLIAFIFMFAGISIFYFYFGTDKKSMIIIGSTIFFVGSGILLVQKFQFINTDKLIFPAIFFVTGFDILLLYFNDIREKSYLIISLIILLLNILFIQLQSSFGLNSLFNSLVEIANEYWIYFLFAMIGLITILIDKKKFR